MYVGLFLPYHTQETLIMFCMLCQVSQFMTLFDMFQAGTIT